MTGRMRRLSHDAVTVEEAVGSRSGGRPQTGWRVDRFPQEHGQDAPSVSTPTVEFEASYDHEPEVWLIIGKAAQMRSEVVCRRS